MTRLLTRVTCLLICFQLAVGCNSSQIAVTGSNSTLFQISGSIVKTFERLNNLILPSAMAAATGTVVAYNYTDPDNIFEIASQTLYNNSKTFKFSIPTDQVEGQVIHVVYEKSTADDTREKFENVDDYIITGSMELVLDADGTFDSALIEQEIKNLASATPEDVKDIIKNFDFTEEKGLFKKGKGEVANFTDPYLKERLPEFILQFKNKEITEGDFSKTIETLRAEAKTQLIAGGRLNCSEKLISLDETAKFSGKITFTTNDAASKGAFSDSSSIGEAKSAAEGTAVLDKFYEFVNKVVKEKAFTFKGYLTLVDDVNKISSKCTFEVSPAPPEASSVYFDNYDVNDYGKLAEAVSDLDGLYNKTIDQLKKDFETGHIDLKTEAGIAKFKVQSQKIDEWYNDYLDEAVFTLAKK